MFSFQGSLTPKNYQRFLGDSEIILPHNFPGVNASRVPFGFFFGKTVTVDFPNGDSSIRYHRQESLSTPFSKNLFLKANRTYCHRFECGNSCFQTFKALSVSWTNELVCTSALTPPTTCLPARAGFAKAICQTPLDFLPLAFYQKFCYSFRAAQ